MLNKVFHPKEYEERLYEKMRPYFAHQKKDPRFCMVIPPPNVTGTLHLGHALNTTLQDVLIRFKKLCGFDILWQPGTDHAGIATQMVVERQLAQEGKTRQDLGRSTFLERVWEWKEQSGNTILGQQKRLGAALDWDRTRFTMDEGLSKAVLKVFVQLYREGLIYKAKRLVNWDPYFQTAISDVEVISKEVEGSFYHIFYPLAHDPYQGIVVATTRPETLFGDLAVAVHPEDERYKHLIGQRVRLPLTHRTIPIIADEYCDPDKGTGAVKITPSHDFNDFLVGERHNLGHLNILDAKAHLNENVPVEYRGLSIPQARAKVLQSLTDQNLLLKIEKTKQTVPHGDRSDVEIQPWLTDQWFMNVKPLAERAIAAVEEGRTEFVPKIWENTFFEWMRNIQPWCVSRQLWWGHQIPAWYGPDDTVFVAETEAEALEMAHQHFGRPFELKRDEDVLDTWFSSALWPFSTLGWPDKLEDLNFYYPTNVLSTGFDIIFFWVARMMMMGLHFMNEVPFKTIYIHGLIRDVQGKKMSKSKGNIIDPLALMDEYGADALRLSLALLAVPGRDIKIDESRVQLARNFTTKIWNAARFLQMNEVALNPYFNPNSAQHPLNQWILSQVSDLEKNVKEHLESFRFDLASQAVYRFLWDQFCDVYVECLKPLLTQTEWLCETRHTAAFVFVSFLKIAHPFIPFMTDRLWEEFGDKALDPLLAQLWPSMDPVPYPQEIDVYLRLTEEVRSLKGLLALSPTLKFNLYVLGDTQGLRQNWDWIAHLGRLSNYFVGPAPSKAVPLNIGEQTFYLDLGAEIDFEAAFEVLTKKIEDLQKDCERLKAKLSNEAYRTAKPEAFEKDQELHQNKEIELKKALEILRSSEGVSCSPKALENLRE